MTATKATMTHDSDDDHYARTCFYDGAEEQTLVAAAQAGITEAMDELLVRHKMALYCAARRFTRSHEDAQDLVQDAMLRAFVNVRKFRKGCQFATWLIAIVNNAALSIKRKGKNTYFVSIDSRHEDVTGLTRLDFPDVRPNPEQEVMQQEVRTVLHTVLLRQPRIHQILRTVRF
jgi:RNA polymerase sigma-70 factor, ECF subfamily